MSFVFTHEETPKIENDKTIAEKIFFYHINILLCIGNDIKSDVPPPNYCRSFEGKAKEQERTDLIGRCSLP